MENLRKSNKRCLSLYLKTDGQTQGRTTDKDDY